MTFDSIQCFQHPHHDHCLHCNTVALVWRKHMRLPFLSWLVLSPKLVLGPPAISNTDDSGLLLNWATKCHFCGLLRFLWCIEFFSFNQQLFITSYVLWTVNKIIQSSSLDLARSTSRDAVSTRLPNSKDKKGPKRLRKWRCNLCLLSPCSPWLAWSYLHSQQSRMSPQEIWEQRGRLRTSPPTGSPPGCLVVDVSTHPVDDVG